MKKSLCPKGILLMIAGFLVWSGANTHISAQKTITQGYIWGVKGGPSYLTQKGHYRASGYSFGWHADVYYETYSSETNNSLYFQLGYHQRGSGLTRSYFRDLRNIQLPGFQFDNPKFLYYNAVIEAGVKKNYSFNDMYQPYWGFGLRGEYTFGTNLEEYRSFNEEYKAPIYPAENFVRHYQYGINLLVGLVVPVLPEEYEGFAELRLCQDLSTQYFQPPIPGAGYRDPYTGQQRDLSEISARNFTIELSFGLRIFRVYEYER